MPTVPDPDLDPADEGALIDALRGELAPAAREPLEARLRASPGLRSAQARLRAVLRAERDRFAEEEREAAADAPRLAAAIVDRVHRDEAAARHRARARAAGRRRWARLLAASIGVHVVVLLAFAWHVHSGPPRDEPAALDVAYEAAPPDWGPAPGEDIAERLAEALGDMDPAELAHVPGDVVAFDGDPEPELVPELRALARDAVRVPRVRYPRGTSLQLSRRANEALKRRRLRALGYDPAGTLTKVRLGLSYLRGQQRADGSFPPAGGRSALRETAVAMLAFLGDGRHAKLPGEAGAPVARGLAWIRGRIADPGAAPEDLAVALVALSEDYMLSYGRLRLSEVRRRGEEIRRLAEAARQAASAEPVPGGEPWSVWALHAAERTGLVRRSPEQQARYHRWVAAATRAPERPRDDTLAVLTRGTALLSLERGARKPRFDSWRDATTEDLLSRLLPNGKAKGAAPGPRVQETALLLLALQTAYRTY